MNDQVTCKCYNENFDKDNPCLNCANNQHDEHCSNPSNDSEEWEDRFKAKFQDYDEGDTIVSSKRLVEDFIRQELLKARQQERQKTIKEITLDLAVIAVNTLPEKVVSELAKKLKELSEDKGEEE